MHYNYARWLSVHLYDLLCLETDVQMHINTARKENFLSKRQIESFQVLLSIKFTDKIMQCWRCYASSKKTKEISIIALGVRLK